MTRPVLPTAALIAVAVGVLALAPGGFVPFVFPKLCVFALAVACALAVRGARLPTPVAVLLGVALVVFTAAGLSSGTPAASLVGRWPRYEGLPTVLLYALCVVAGARVLGDRARFDAWRDIASGLALVLAVGAGLEAAGLHPLGEYDVSRAGSFLGNATSLGLVAAMLLCLLLGSRRPLHVAGLLAAAATLAMSGSRASYLAVLVGLLVWAVLAKRWRLVAVAVPVLMLPAVLLPGLRDRLTSGATVQGRALLWQDTWSLLGDHPVTGVGPSRFVDVIARHHSADWWREVGPQDPPDSPHSFPLQLLVSGGVPLLLVALLLGGVVVHRGVLAARAGDVELPVLAAAACTYAAGLLVNFTTAGATCLAAFLLGALVAVPGAPPRRALRAGGVAVALVLATGFAFATASEYALENGMARAVKGQTEAAEEAFTWARRLRGSDSDICLLAAQALALPADRGDQQAAQAAEEQALCSLRRTPESSGAGLALAVAQLAQGRADQALATAEHFLALDPGNQQLAGIRARAAADVGPGERVSP